MVKWVHYQYACYARKFKMNPCETNLRKAKNSTSKVSIKVHPCETNCGEIKTVQGVYKIVKSHCDFNMMDLKKLYGFLWILIFIKTRTSKIQKRATEQKIGNIILVYQILNVSEDCSVGQKFIKANCTDSEHAICLRNYTWKNLVAVCVDNIPMHGLCPVLTLAKKNGRIPFITIQMDHQSICDNCSHYYLWDVGKYPQCLTLEMNSAAITTNFSNSIPNIAGKGEENYANGLSGGGIAGIVIGVLLMIILLVILIVLHRAGYLQKLDHLIDKLQIEHI